MPLITPSARRKVGKWLLTALGGAVVVYSLAVIGFVATIPDLGIRCLLVDESTGEERSTGEGLLIRRVAARRTNPERIEPRAGDRLLAIARQPAETFLHFARQLIALRGAQVSPGGHLYSDADLLDQGDLLPPVVERGSDRLVEARFDRAGRVLRTWVPVESVPWTDLLMTVVWFLLEFGIFAVGALAFWARPFDRHARVFFAMCIVTMGGFVGGYHWWMISGTLWLTVPFMVCAMLVPIVTLHFFLIYPEPKRLVVRFPRLTVAAVYAVPVVYVVALAALVFEAHRLYDQQAPPGQIVEVLGLVNDAVYIYLAIAAGYFMVTLAALADSFLTIRNPIIHSQVKWILWAAVVATLPVGYTLSLAYFDRERFALGAASLPMFAASLLFMLAYAVGIVRYKLMLVEELLSRGMVYYLLSLLVAAGYSLAIAAASVAGFYSGAPVARQVPGLVLLIVAAVLVLTWTRNRLQQLIDREFFREKFQLDRVLSAPDGGGAGFVDPAVLAQRMLVSCRDLLGADRAAVYLRDGEAGGFRLIGSQSMDLAPQRFSTDEELLELIRQDPNVKRQESSDGPAPAAAQRLLHELDVDLLHALEVDGNLAGALLLGAKRNGTPYTAEDLALLATLGQNTSAALHGARVHQAVLRLNDELRLKIEKIGEQTRLISMLQAEITSRQQPVTSVDVPPFRSDLLRGSSPAIRQVLDTVRKVSGSQSSVLIRGESGTGKELLAQAIHENSPRRGGPMVGVHCGALSPGLLESELFGHVKGAFTGAHRDRVGRFELAHGGTLFLDEIGDISLDTQIKLLRVLQERAFEPVGGTRTIEVDVRLITATHQNLEWLIQEGKFREDLFYRLNVISIGLPPLRDRGDDVLELALFFLARAAERAGKPITHFEPQALEALERYAWPGNVRELENAIERAVVMSEGSQIALADLPANLVEAPPGPVFEAKPVAMRPQIEPAGVFSAAAPREARLAAERQALVEALARCQGNKAEAARLLGLPRSTFFSRLRKHGLP